MSRWTEFTEASLSGRIRKVAVHYEQEGKKSAPVTTLTALRTQVGAALDQLLTTTKRVQEIAAENDALRREVADLRHQLAGSATPQPA